MTRKFIEKAQCLKCQFGWKIQRLFQILRNLDWKRGKERQRNYLQERKNCGKRPERVGVAPGSWGIGLCFGWTSCSQRPSPVLKLLLPTLPLANHPWAVLERNAVLGGLGVSDAPESGKVVTAVSIIKQTFLSSRLTMYRFYVWVLPRHYLNNHRGSSYGYIPYNI